MPDEEKKTVDIDTSGPDATIDIEETKDEAVIEQPEENTEQETVTQESTKEEPKKSDEELEDYSKGVQSRIAKLTRKMREAERQREEAVAYAQSIKSKNDEMEGRISKMDSSYVSEFETRVKTGLAAAKLALKMLLSHKMLKHKLQHNSN